MKEYDPDKEIDLDDLQRRQLELGEKLMEKLEKAEAGLGAPQGAESPDTIGPPVLRSVFYTPPTFEAVSGRVKRAWDEVNRIIPDAPEGVKLLAFQSLMSHMAD